MGPLRDNGMASNNNKIYKARGYEGENNMGKLTMQLARFMTQECGWTLQVCDSGNLGYSGDIREQQMKFKAPHPLNMIAPLIMIELRQVGYIEVNGENKDDIFNKLSGFFKSTWKAETIKNDPDYCDLKFSTSAFHKRGGEGENNMGLRTMELVDFMVKKCQWTMVTCNTGNFGRKGDKREQQLIFRNDEFVQHGIDHLMVELRTVGYIEINGMHDAQDLQPHLIEFLTTQWGCKEYSKYFWESDEMLSHVSSRFWHVMFMIFHISYKHIYIYICACWQAPFSHISVLNFKPLFVFSTGPIPPHSGNIVT